MLYDPWRENVPEARPAPNVLATCYLSVSRARELYEIVSEITGVPMPHLLSDQRTRPIAIARHLVAYAMRLSRASFPMIGLRMQLDHSTVVSSIKRLNMLVAADPAVAALAARVRMSVDGAGMSAGIRGQVSHG
jgi:chromosomal replication initiation ATPase DnaA